jgi:hypothetical protein
VANGLTNREIATRIYVSPNTIMVHLRNIFYKTGVASRTELSMLAVKEGWVSFLKSQLQAENVSDVSQAECHRCPGLVLGGGDSCGATAGYWRIVLVSPVCV